MLGVLVTVFLLLRCAYRISPATNTLKETNGRRVSDDQFPNPCEVPQQEKQGSHPRQRQGIAGAVAARPEAAASHSSGEGAAALGPPTAPSPAGYSPATHLDQADLYVRLALMEAWMVQAEDVKAELGEASQVTDSVVEDLVRKGGKITKDLEGIIFSDGIQHHERQQFMSTVSKCTELLQGLLKSVEGRWANACEKQKSLLKSSYADALSHLQHVLRRRRVGPEDPAVEKMKQLREALNEARKVYEKVESISNALPKQLSLREVLEGLQAIIAALEESLTLAANACAEAWIRYLTTLRQESQAEGAGDEVKEKLLEEMQTAKILLPNLRFISGSAPPK
ncbi:hypothetical protein, conserved [Eimeria praecox]|uniref:Uncharacterized protein n=1 Tax=Eimeria praecox TaxID=51316 RepID=U6H627_9EIME|nr:hypothetical protein, conserved [Eimeria praecox]